MPESIKAYPNLRKIIDIDDTPLGFGKESEQHWSLEDHVVNLMARTRRLVRGIENDMPPFFLEKEIELCEERLSELKQIINREETK